MAGQPSAGTTLFIAPIIIPSRQLRLAGPSSNLARSSVISSVASSQNIEQNLHLTAPASARVVRLQPSASTAALAPVPVVRQGPAVRPRHPGVGSTAALGDEPIRQWERPPEETPEPHCWKYYEVTAGALSTLWAAGDIVQIASLPA